MSNARKRLPVKPSAEHLRKQAKRRQRLAEGRTLADVQYEMAQEYGCRNWGELMHVVETMLRGADQLSNVKYDWEALPKAVNEDDIDRVREILASGKFTQHDLDLGLARALYFPKRRELAELLVEHGADVDGQYGSDYGPIVLVTGEGLNADALQFMIDHGCDVTFSPIKSKYGQASPMGHTLGSYVRGRNEHKHRCIEILEKHGAYMPPEVTPPMMAIHKGDAKLLKQMLRDDPGLVHRQFPDMPYGNISLKGATLFHLAAEYAEIECINVLLDHGADINVRAMVIDGVGGQTPVFHAAAAYDHWKAEALPLLTERVGEWLDTSVRATVKRFDERIGPVSVMELYNKNTEILELLKPLDVKTKLKTALRRGDTKSANELIDAHPEALGIDLWPAAIIEGKSLEATRLLAERGLSVDQCTAPRKPLHLAVYPCLPEIVQYLLEQGADPNQQNPLGETPLELLNAYETRPVGDPDASEIRQLLLEAGVKDSILAATRAGEIETVKHFLSESPESIHQLVPIDGLSVLAVAACCGRVEIVRLLLEKGMAVDGANELGNTPLWFACRSLASIADRLEVAKVLLEAGASVNHPCEDGETPLEAARNSNELELIALLESYFPGD
ncbi:ankyrin repeat domain-containing protein [Rubellicoccus peritrichatus]|uniref:Ankyrin repeat domain-containing protein n=1 Tax=Rubellicoccus peritrichatus TaxID=3080537 RepID=A0AAQ3LA37_9BACT|nr:ankyrin repeat domain-containing protein [Puniceicoccus sp. CR14]WOO41621.1 ankyrin repeat domain-containing protein [Puniceicoccus sp. CR14]